MPRPLLSSSRRQSVQRHVVAWKESGLSRRDYSHQQGIPASTFSRWCRRFLPEVLRVARLSSPPHASPVGDAGEVKLVRVFPAAPTGSGRAPQKRPPLVLVVDRRFRLVLPDGFSPSTLREALRVLAGLP